MSLIQNNPSTIINSNPSQAKLTTAIRDIKEALSSSPMPINNKSISSTALGVDNELPQIRFPYELLQSQLGHKPVDINIPPSLDRDLLSVSRPSKRDAVVMYDIPADIKPADHTEELKTFLQGSYLDHHAQSMPSAKQGLDPKYTPAHKALYAQLGLDPEKISLHTSADGDLLSFSRPTNSRAKGDKAIMFDTPADIKPAGNAEKLQNLLQKSYLDHHTESILTPAERLKKLAGILTEEAKNYKK